LKQAILRTIVAWVDVDEVFLELRMQFAALDTNRDGVLTRAEIESGLAHLGLSEADLENNLDAIMGGRFSRQIEYTEFLSAALVHGNFLTQNLAMKIFQCLDSDGDGVISQEDLEHVYRRNLPMWTLRQPELPAKKATMNLLREANLEGVELNFAQFRSWLGVVGGEASPGPLSP